MEILPIKVVTLEDAPIFGGLNVSLGKLARLGLPVGRGIVVAPPEFKLKAVLEHFAFGKRELFEQSLNLVKKEISKVPIPEVLQQEIKKQNKFLLSGQEIKGIKNLWQTLLRIWLEEIKSRLWQDGFYPGITQNLDPQAVIFVKRVEAQGAAYFDTLGDDTVINIREGKLHPNDLKKLDEMVRQANRKLFIPHEYEWIVDGGVRLTKVLPYTPVSASSLIIPEVSTYDTPGVGNGKTEVRSAVKVFLDLSSGLVVESQVDGVFIASEKIFDLNKSRDSFEDLVFRLVESATTFPNSPILFKLADMSEGLPARLAAKRAGRQGMGKVRGTLRLLHQKSLFEPMIDALDFARHKKGLTNVHIVIPFVRGVNELLQIKRELAVKKLSRKNSLQLWMEAAVPENIVNLEDYLMVGLDGVVLNMDELTSHLNGFDTTQEDLLFYKNEVDGLIKFLEDGIRLLHRSKIPFIAYGTLSLYPKVLEFLVGKGVWGIVVEKYEAPSAKDLLYQTEKRLILRKSA